MRRFLYIGFALVLSGCLSTTEKYRVARYGVCGLVKDGESNIPISNVFVIAYYYKDVSGRVPEFKFTVTDKDGLFRIPNEYEEFKTEQVPFLDRAIKTLFPSPVDDFSREMWEEFRGPEKPAGLFVSVDGRSVVDCTRIAWGEPWLSDPDFSPIGVLQHPKGRAKYESVRERALDICEILRLQSAPIPQAFSIKQEAGETLEIIIRSSN